MGLGDRVHALGGRIEITSPAGIGTTLLVSLPVEQVDDLRPSRRDATAAHPSKPIIRCRGQGGANRLP